MKEGKTLTELAQELDRQVKSKRDYLADTRSLAITEDGASIKLQDNGNLKIREHCHNQIAARLGIPTKYYNKMRKEAPLLLAENVNHWFQAKPERRLVRALDGCARAFLSDKYRPLDNFDLAEAILPKIKDMKCEVKSAELTETRFYIKVITPQLKMQVKEGDIVRAGLVISNSEVGCGSVRVEPLVYRLVCLNGMIMPDYGLKKYHIGRRSGDIEFEGAVEFFRNETRIADDRVFWMKVRNVVEGALSRVKFESIVRKLQQATEKKIKGNPVKAVEVVSNRFSFADNEQGSVLQHLISGGDLSAYGLSNAVSRASQDLEDYDRATEFERIGGIILELPRRDWEMIALAN